ncbi:MAG TPA: hypothetical protein VIE65_20240 [Methylobacter sp.]
MIIPENLFPLILSNNHIQINLGREQGASVLHHFIKDPCWGACLNSWHHRGARIAQVTL